jgi:hypothetical protein
MKKIYIEKIMTQLKRQIALLLFTTIVLVEILNVWQYADPVGEIADIYSTCKIYLLLFTFSILLKIQIISMILSITPTWTYRLRP